MSRTIALVTIAALATACSKAQDMRTLPSRHGSSVTVNTRDGLETKAFVQATPDGGFVLRVSDGRFIPYEQVASVVETRNGRGAAHGLGLGILIGAGTGVLLGYADGDDECENEDCILAWSASGKAVVFGITFGLLGAVVGALVGGLKGSDDVYSFGAQQQYRITPAGPPGSAVGASITF